MSKRPRKRYDHKLRLREQAHKVASDYVVSSIIGIDKAAYVFDHNLNHVRLSSSVARMINDVRHHWSIAVCVAGRHKDGSVWVKYEQANSSIQANAYEMSPLVIDLVEEFFNQQDDNQRLCRWWVAVPAFDHIFSAEELITPIIRANAFRAFTTKYEDETEGVSINYPIGKYDMLTNEEFKTWWDCNVSSQSPLQQLWIEE